MLRFRRLIPILFVLAMLASLLPVGLVSAQSGSADTWASRSRTASGANYVVKQEAEFLALINEYRQANGLEPLGRNIALDAASRGHSKDMAMNGYFSHTSQDGRSPWNRIEQAGYSCNGAKAENIAAGQPSAQAAFNAWKDSEGHNRNMLSDSYSAIGIGLYYDPSSPYKYYWTTDFGECA